MERLIFHRGREQNNPSAPGLKEIGGAERVDVGRPILQQSQRSFLIFMNGALH